MESYTYKENDLDRIVEKIKAHVYRKFSSDHATVVVFEGELGAGKTTCIRALVKSLGSRDTVQSPTFVIMREYALPLEEKFKKILHIDAYRLTSSKEIIGLRFEEYLKNPSYLILIEWGSLIHDVIPSYALMLNFTHTNDPAFRTLNIGQ